MKPILYKSTENTFSTNGIGVLSDVLSCVVEEERNGAYELTMEYPVGGVHFSELVSRAIILAKPNSSDQPQPFRIYQIGKPLNGIVTVYAQHISYDLSGVAVSPFSATGIDNVISAMLANAVPSDHGFTLTTDKAGSTGIMTDVPSSFRTLLGGTEGSLLDIYGGEYKYDRFAVSLLDKRGAKRDFAIRYGKNMTSFEQEENCADIYTDVYPYWTSGDEKVFLDEKTVRASGTYDFTKVLPLDLSSYFETAPSKEALKATAQNYMTANKIGVPKVSLKLSYEDFAENQDETIGLCDTVTVIFPALNVNTEAKIVRVEYDVLLERYKSLEIGSTASSLANTIVDNAVSVSEILGAPGLQQAINNATSWLTKMTGGNVVFGRNANGSISAIYIVNNKDAAKATDVWAIGINGIGFSKNGIGGPYETAITPDGNIVGKFVTADGLQVNGANITGTLKADSVIASSIKAGSVTTDKIADNAVEGGKIPTDAIENKHIQSKSIHTTTCNDTINGYFQDVIQANKIFAGSATIDKLVVNIVSAVNGINLGGKSLYLSGGYVRY